MNLELEKAGIKEKQEKNKAVASAAKDNDADIISGKLFSERGVSFH